MGHPLEMKDMLGGQTVSSLSSSQLASALGQRFLSVEQLLQLFKEEKDRLGLRELSVTLEPKTPEETIRPFLEKLSDLISAAGLLSHVGSTRIARILALNSDCTHDIFVQTNHVA